MKRIAALGLLALTACAPPTPDADDEGKRSSSSMLDGKPCAYTGIISNTSGDQIRLRSGPSTTSDILGNYREGDRVSVKCTVRGQFVDGTDVWNRVVSPDGYVHGAYVSLDNAPPYCESDDVKPPPPVPGGGTGTSTGFRGIWGNLDAPITFEFLAGGGRDLYAYGLEYGLNGSAHPGIDVGVPYNTPLYSPASGVIRCAGTNVGTGTAGGGCAAFNDWGDGASQIQGVGRIEIELDSGAVLILGHSRTSAVNVGQRVRAGERVGTSGGMYGAHVHIEARVRGATRSGWSIVDARTVIE